MVLFYRIILGVYVFDKPIINPYVKLMYDDDDVDIFVGRSAKRIPLDIEEEMYQQDSIWDSIKYIFSVYIPVFAILIGFGFILRACST